MVYRNEGVLNNVLFKQKLGLANNISILYYANLNKVYYSNYIMFLQQIMDNFEAFFNATLVNYVYTYQAMLQF